MVRRVTFVSVMLLLVTSWTYASVALPATVKVWDTAVPLGLTPGVSLEDPTGLTGHGTTLPTIVTAYARSTYPGAPSGVVYWNPDSNTFVLYGVTSSGPYPGWISIAAAGPYWREGLAGRPSARVMCGSVGSRTNPSTCTSPGRTASAPMARTIG